MNFSYLANRQLPLRNLEPCFIHTDIPSKPSLPQEVSVNIRGGQERVIPLIGGGLRRMPQRGRGRLGFKRSQTGPVLHARQGPAMRREGAAVGVGFIRGAASPTGLTRRPPPKGPLCEWIVGVVFMQLVASHRRIKVTSWGDFRDYPFTFILQ